MREYMIILRARRALQLVRHYACCRSGAVAVEYVVIASAMFGALIPAFLYVASGMGTKFTSITSYFSIW